MRETLSELKKKKGKSYQVQCTFVCMFHASWKYPTCLKPSVEWILQHKHTHTECKFASLFVLKSEMKINRKRIQNSCAYFSCSVFVSSTFFHSTRVLTNRWRVGYYSVFLCDFTNHCCFFHHPQSENAIFLFRFDRANVLISAIPITMPHTHF